MSEENRIDLPHDQVAQDNDGQVTNEENQQNLPLADDGALGNSKDNPTEDTPPLYVDEEKIEPDVGLGRALDTKEEEKTTPNLEVGEEFAADQTPIGFDEGVSPQAAPNFNVDEEIAPELAEGARTLDDVNEETAAEVAPDVRRSPVHANEENQAEIDKVQQMDEEEAGGAGLGWTALVLSIISLFFLPVLTASIGVVTGYFAYRNGARTLGMWAIAIGLFSVVMGLFFVPLVAR